MTLRLTESAIRKATGEVREIGKRRELVDEVCRGLRLRITPAGSRTWVLACRDRRGSMRRFGLGSFPQMGISQARDAAQATRARVKEGVDPIADKRRERAIGRAAKEGTGTLASLLALYGRQRGGDLRTWDESKRRIEVVFKAFLVRPLVDLDARTINMHADAYQSKQAAAAAVRYLRPI